MWSWREELNLQPSVYKTDALPLSYASTDPESTPGLRSLASLDDPSAVSCRRGLTEWGGWSILPP